jgi:cytidylate kinase
MAVITISREAGSGGYPIAKAVAESLGYAFADKNTTDSIFRQYGMTRFDDLYDSGPSLLDLLNANNLLLVAMANEIVEAVAQRGDVVILGRAGFAVLSGLADVLHVRIQAPFSDRVKYVMERDGITDLDAAMEHIKQDDEVHRKYVSRFYNRQWDEASNFDLVLDTGSLAIEQAAKQIVDAARELQTELQSKPLPDGASSTKSLQVDPVLADAVAKAMGSRVAAAGA